MDGPNSTPCDAPPGAPPVREFRAGRRWLRLGGLLDAPSRQVTGAAIVIAVTVLALFVQTQWRSYERAIARAERDTRNAAFLLAEHAARTFEGIDFTLHAVERLRGDVALGIYRSQASIHINLKTLLSGSPVLHEIGWFDVYGERRASSAAIDPPRLSIAGDPLFLAAREDEDHGLHIVAPQQPADAWQIAVWHRLTDPSGSFAGIAVGMVDPQEFARVYRALDLGPGVRATLFRADGLVLAHVPESTARPGYSAARAELFQVHLLQARHGTYPGPDPFDGIEQIVSYASVENFGVGLVMSVAMARDHALAGFRRELRLQAAIASLVLVLLLVGTCLIVSGLRRREQLQAQLSVALQAADAAGQAKSEFLAAMSHELRTPLNAVIGFSEMLTHEVFGPLGNPRYHDYAQTIVDSGTHLLGLINDVLDLSKLDAGRLDLQEEVVEIEGIAADCLRMMEAQAGKAGVALVLEIEDRLPQLRADHRRIRQILLNLLSNATKFTPEGGEVRLSASRRDGAVVLQVADTGIGMASDDLPKAIEYFGQIDSRLSRRYSGSGLGLPLSKGLVELHGGTLAIESVLGEGTTVSVTLPAERALDYVESAALQSPAGASRAG